MPIHHRSSDEAPDVAVRPQFTHAGSLHAVPRLELPQPEMPADSAYQIVHDELLLDGNPRLNLATFVTTWMEPAARQLMSECMDKNLVDKDEYPRTAELERRCVAILARLWGTADDGPAVGTSTTGSSEAAMLAGMALKRRWAKRRRDAGRPEDRPNLVMGANVQVCWEKFCRYWDVEPRLVPVGDGSTCLTPDAAVAHCDERTIGVVAILGSTFDGSYEPVAEIAAALDRLQDERGLDVPMHVDAASGGFVAPFIDPDLVWDFRIARVASINASGHKYGLVYPGVGWAIWRDRAALPEELIFHVDYLGGDMPTFALNFSRPGAQVAAQYYMFLRLGWDGFRRVTQTCRDNARWLAAEIAEIGPFELISDGSGIPAFAFRLREGFDEYTVFDVSETLRMKSWIVPAYRMPPALEDLAVLRIVVRSDFSYDLGAILLDDLRWTVKRLESARRRDKADDQRRAGFHH
jgi:glutamate decarboxylase